MLRIVCATVLALCALRRVASGATTFTVDRQDDNASATACTAAPNDCTLRGAIIAANATMGPDTINLPAGTYTLSIDGAAEDMAATGDLDIRDDLTLLGAGATTTVIDGGQLDRVIHSDPAGTGIAVTISGVTIQHGKTEVIAFVLSDGGGIRNGTSGTMLDNTGGTLTIMNSVIKNNTTPRGGGGIGNVGTLILADSTVSGNTAGTNGGGILQDDPGSTSIVRSTISGNTAGEGGGIFSGLFSITADPVVTVSDSTLSG